MKMESSVERKLTRARTQILLNQPFFGTLCLRLKLTPGEFPTMATDGSRIVYDSAFVNTLQPAELEAVLAHEVLHCALGHHCRRGERDLQLWNEAADLAINPILVGNGFRLPAGALLDSAFANLSAEEIYARLFQARNNDYNSDPQQLPTSSGRGDGAGRAGPRTDLQQASDPASPAAGAAQQIGNSVDPTEVAASARPGGFGEVLDAIDQQGAPASQAEKSRQQHEWSIAADQAMRSARMCGRQPAKLNRPLHESRQSKQDWRGILRDFIASRMPADYCWSPPNRRHIASGLYLPSMQQTGVGPIVIAVDTSGSIGNKELQQFAGEISAIADEAQPEAIYVVYCDAAV
ncbi:MAG TPA: VWA-like domain-containing protein, partial [Terriglobales bacterium]|nr:VWA-like domain-containing protein [Terriglobales bacterium]